MAELPRITRRDHSGGIQRKSVEAMKKPNQVLHIQNGECDSKIGAITGRKGSLKQSTVVASSLVHQLFIYRHLTTRKFLALSEDAATPTNTDIMLSAAADFAGAWSKSLEDWTTATRAFFENFIGKAFIFNGVNTPKQFNGTTWATVTNAPTTGKYPAVFNQRLYVLGEDGFLNYSDVVDATGLAFSSTTWSNRGINPYDGQKGKGLVNHRGRLVIFKEESIYRYANNTNEPESIIDVGTHSDLSIVKFDNLYFHHPTGIYRMGAGDPVLISQAVDKYLEGMSAANWPNVAAGRDLRNVYFWIGNVTINDPFEPDYGETYTDVVLVLNVFTGAWSVFTGWNARAWSFDKDNGNAYFATAAGKIFKINTNYADVDGITTTPIPFGTMFHAEDFGYPELEKKIGTIVVGGKYQSKIRIGNDPKTILEAGQLDNGVGEANKSVSGKKIYVGVYESYADRPPRIQDLIFDDIEIYDERK
jgi:hypothetical protein